MKFSCDLCGVSCTPMELTPLRSIYQSSTVTDVCPKCGDWANAILSELQGKVVPQMKNQIELHRVTLNRLPSRRYICGMVPWMFWTLLFVTLFAIFGPLLPLLFRS